MVRQIFTARHYQQAAKLTDIRTVVDCGANIGLASAYLLAHHPLASLVAVEPHPDNLRLCRRNLAPFAERVSYFESAIWPEKAGVQFRNPEGSEASYQVMAMPGARASDLSSTTIPEIMTAERMSRIDLLKIDIEGSEAELFSRNVTEWLPRVRNIAIELHTSHDRAVFVEALRGFQFDHQEFGEMTFCTNIVPTTAEP